MSKKHKLEIVARSHCGGYRSKNVELNVEHINYIRVNILCRDKMLFIS